MRIKIILGVCVLLYLAFRFIQNVRMKSGTKNLVDQVKKDPEVAEEFAKSLNFRVLKKEISNPNFDQILTAAKIGDFLIQHSEKLNDGSYLFITTATSGAFLSVGRQSVESNEVHNLNFVLRPLSDQNEYAVSSDMYITLTDKTLRKEFALALLKLIENSKDVGEVKVDL